MSVVPEFTTTMHSTQMTNSTMHAQAKPRETTRRIIAGVGMITPVAAFIALTVWYVAL